MKILVLANFGLGLFNFRKELLEELIKQGNKVYITLPNDEYVSKLIQLGCTFIESNVDRRGTNPLKDIKLLLQYIRIIKEVKPDIVLSYTIKPNVYGGIACRITKTPYIANITGLGTSIENNSPIQKLTLYLYKIGLKKANCIFFQNKVNQNFFINKKITKLNKSKLLPGSGVNLTHHQFEEYPETDTEIHFLFIGRIMKAKGIDELLSAARIVKNLYRNVEFHLIGPCEEDYSNKLEELHRLNIINYYGQQEDVHSFIKKSHATILPSYHEGTANVLLETSSSGRPILASKVPGCVETFDEGITGFGFEVRNVESLVKAITKFIKLPIKQKRQMGIYARRKMEREFDRKIVVEAYSSEIKKTINKENNNEPIREIS